MPNAIEQGEQLTVEQAIANLVGDDLGLRFYSAWWLGRFKVADIHDLNFYEDILPIVTKSVTMLVAKK